MLIFALPSRSLILVGFVALCSSLGEGAMADWSAVFLIEIARTKTRDEALAALDVWRARHPEAAAALEPTDILVDGMRGPRSIWYRIRINLEHVPQPQRPAQEELIADYSPWEGYSGHQRP